MSFDAYAMRAELSAIQSQSLWNRAMSFDGKDFIKKWFTLEVSIPLEQGNVFRRKPTDYIIHVIIVSIPLEQGNVFRRLI